MVLVIKILQEQLEYIDLVVIHCYEMARIIQKQKDLNLIKKLNYLHNVKTIFKYQSN
jgi:hypothetical protein